MLNKIFNSIKKFLGLKDPYIEFARKYLIVQNNAIRDYEEYKTWLAQHYQMDIENMANSYRPAQPKEPPKGPPPPPPPSN